MNTNELVERAYRIIRANRYLTMATCAGRDPWIAPLAYVVEPDYSFIYYTATTSRHGKHTAENPVVACAIFDSTASSDDADGIQFSGRVQEVPANELDRVMKLYFEQSFPDAEVRKRWMRPAEDFKGAAIQRFYRITPLEMYTIDLNSPKVDKRVPVDLHALRKKTAR
jgi:uncharacterized protein YhbP (UPF0306 family)